MALFELNGSGKLKEIPEKEFKLEIDLQKICENNIGSLLGLKFIKSEFSIENYRFDTLAYDEENKSFVIIEYKKGQNYSVIDQGYAYLATMLNNKADFILEFNENFDVSLKRNDIEWSQSKIIFISQNFNKFQKDTINFKDLPIELYEIKRFEDGIISFDEIKGNRISTSIKNVSIGNEAVQKVSSEIKKYTLDDCLSTGTQETIELFEEFRNRIEEMLPDIKIEPKKLYIAFRKNKKNIVDFRIQKKQLKIWLNIKKGELNDNKSLFRDVSDIGHWGNGDYETAITDNEYLEYILSLIKEVYKCQI
jgi:predicted transport protein